VGTSGENIFTAFPEQILHHYWWCVPKVIWSSVEHNLKRTIFPISLTFNPTVIISLMIFRKSAVVDTKLGILEFKPS
jgi:hypothetical protein